MSTDPVMGEYFPEASSNEGASERNQNLPGLGGLYNSRNLQTYHYAGNNPLKYTDPTGRNSWEIDQQNKRVMREWQERNPEGYQEYQNYLKEMKSDIQSFLQKYGFDISIGKEWGLKFGSVGFSFSLIENKLIFNIDLAIITIDNENGVQLNTSISFNIVGLSVSVDLWKFIKAGVEDLFTMIETEIDEFFKDIESKTQEEVNEFYDSLNQRIQKFNEYIEQKYGIQPINQSEE